MKLRLAAILAPILTTAIVFPAMGQQRRAPNASTSRPASQFQANPLPLPTSTILPMTNPIAPMTTAPVQPFVRYQGPAGTPTVVVPPEKAHVGDRRNRRNDHIGPAVIYVPYEYIVYEPPPSIPPAPGYLPGTDPGRLPAYSEPAPVLPQTPTYREPENVVITPQTPPLVVQPPALGTARVDVIARYGEPWGRISMRGRDTLYFNGGLTLIFENDRVVEVR